MKKTYLFPLFFAAFAFALDAHDHIEVGFDPANPGRLRAFGSFSQNATYFPTGESPSPVNYPVFPGGHHTTELTFSAFDNIDTPPGNAFVRVVLLAVTGPAGGTFSFWEAGSPVATWTRASGWTNTNTPGDQPSIVVSEDEEGYGHVHSRLFTSGKAGIYDVTFQAVDDLGNHTASLPFTVRFTTIDPPPLLLSLQGGNVTLSFTSRANLSYDVQSSTTLLPGSWTTLDTIDGNGAVNGFTEPLNNRPKVFYRIVEY
ncbi:MAG: hypothetical protein SFU85_05145 [Candidatus Methylacidiphilales bacterium]|nr:hypothetical protein [Candidatus Methylacidiphilales bacterium]